MKKVLLLVLCLLIMASVAHAEERKVINTWVRICQDELKMFHYFSSASIKQYPPNDGTVFDVSVRAVVTDEARKKDKRFARVSYFSVTTHYDSGRGVYRTLSTVDYDAQGKVVRQSAAASAETPLTPGSLEEQTLSAVQNWLAKNRQ